MLRINYKPSTSHWIFPQIIFSVLIILLFAMTVQRYLECRKKKEPFINMSKYCFFIKGWDSGKLIGSVLLFVLYIISMEIIGFLISSIIFVLLFNLLFSGIDHLKTIPDAFRVKKLLKDSGFHSLLISISISVIFPAAIWIIFGKIFRITLP